MAKTVRLVLVLGCLGAMALAALSCGSSTTQREPSGQDPRFVRVTGAAAPKLPAQAPTSKDGCTLTRSGRLYVGLSEGMTLDDFEVAAAQAERMLGFLQQQLCALAPTVDASGVLAAALKDEPLEMFALRFMSDDATEADVEMRRGGAAASITTTLHIVVTQEQVGFRVTFLEPL